MRTVPKPASWSLVVQNNAEMTKYDLQVEEINGMPTAKIPDSVFKNSSPLWEDFLIGKFLAKAPFVGKIHALVNKIWPLGDKTVKIDVFVVDNTTMKFCIKTQTYESKSSSKGHVEPL